MKSVFYKKEEQSVPIKTWLDLGDLGPDAWQQALNLANLPFAFKHIALMPDAHMGYGMPIGGVLAAKNAIVVNAVGMDVGCGVALTKFNIKVEEIGIDQFKKIRELIRENIPIGLGKEHKESDHIDRSMPDTENCLYGGIVGAEFQKARRQLGSLGAGNHFIEFQKDPDGYLYLMIHSGSRNLGGKVAQHYNKLAKDLNKRWFSNIDPKWDLAFFPMDTQEAQDYKTEMEYCVEYAVQNRMSLSNQVLAILGELKITYWDQGEVKGGVLHGDVAHNYAAMEHHFGENVMVHRKGATSAKLDQLGLIPGSQGSKSYIVRGLGNADSFMSCSHGAGRKISRTRAKKELVLEDEIARLDKAGVLHGLRGITNLDEAAGAYKDIDTVMANQADLVEIVTELTPVMCIKG